MEKAVKLRLYPNHSQKQLINKAIGCSRFVYNYFLSRRKECYEQEGKTLTYSKCSEQLTSLKRELSWLQEVDKFALQNSLKDLDRAYKNFFREHAKGNSNWGYPRFKKKHGSRQSYRTNYTNGNIRVDFKARKIKLPRLGWVKFRTDKKIKSLPGDIINVTASRLPSGKYYASVVCEADIKPLPKVNSKVGVDLGIKYYAILSDGEVVPNPKHLQREEKKLAKLQRQLSRKVKFSRNWYKTKLKVVRQHERVANMRLDFLHKLTTRLVNENQVICLEDLNIKGMVKNRRLAKAISDAGWGTFKAMLKYKAEWYGRTVVEIDRFYPSSKLCSTCQTVNPMLTLDQRRWQCPVCRTIHDRDYNSAVNILNEGLKHVS